jgi:hypothetical protein
MMAKVVKNVYPDINPERMSERVGYKEKGDGNYPGYLIKITPVIEDYIGIGTYERSLVKVDGKIDLNKPARLTWDEITKYIDEGYPILVYYAWNQSSEGHFMVIGGYEITKIQDGTEIQKIRLFDPLDSGSQDIPYLDLYNGKYKCKSEKKHLWYATWVPKSTTITELKRTGFAVRV